MKMVMSYTLSAVNKENKNEINNLVRDGKA